VRREELSGQRFEATNEFLEGVRVVAVRGELDIASSTRIRKLLAGAKTDTAQPLVIDLSQCDFIDSTGLAALLHGAKPTQNGESHIAIVSPEGDVRRMLELTAIDQSIPVFESVEQAVAAVTAVGL
jgi:anti-sigma B factor antagonist